MEILNGPKIIGIIPARFSSKRLPGKPLINICGKPLLQWVFEGVSCSNCIHRVIIATDDVRISELCLEIGAEYILTPPSLESGSDRVLYAYESLMEDADIIVNIQGDEPLLTAEVLDKLLCKFANSNADVGTLIKKIDNFNDIDDPSVVKVVTRKDNTAIYFSRSIVPFLRDVNKEDWLSVTNFWKHIGVYAYKKESLMLFKDLPVSLLEKTEKLEQLRLLENNVSFLCVETDRDLLGVDTQEDIERVSKILCNKKH